MGGWVDRWEWDSMVKSQKGRDQLHRVGLNKGACDWWDVSSWQLD